MPLPLPLTPILHQVQAGSNPNPTPTPTPTPAPTPTPNQVWRMPSARAFDACDFSAATELAGTSYGGVAATPTWAGSATPTCTRPS